MIAVSCIVVAAAAISDQFKLQPKRLDTRWVESPRLWVAVVAEPGQKKTPALDSAKEPLQKVEKDWHREHLQQCAEYKKIKKELAATERKEKTNETQTAKTTETEKTG